MHPLHDLLFCDRGPPLGQSMKGKKSGKHTCAFSLTPFLLLLFIFKSPLIVFFPGILVVISRKYRLQLACITMLDPEILSLLFKSRFLKQWIMTTCGSYTRFSGLLIHILKIKCVSDQSRLYPIASHVIKVTYFIKILLAFYSTNIY